MSERFPSTDHVCPERTTCRVCGGPNLERVLSLGTQFVSDFVPHHRVRAGVACPIDLDRCPSCTLVQARYTAPQELLYRKHYWYKSGTTNTMREALADVVSSAVRAANEAAPKTLGPGDVFLDVGSNDGTLLRNYHKGVTRLGCEPATNLATRENYEDQGLSVIRDFWSEAAYRRVAGARQARVVTAIGMFYDLDDPNQFVEDVAKVLHDDGVFVSQLMCLRHMVANRDVGNLAHEHLEFYTLASLDVLFARHGLSIFDVGENDVNGGSYRIFARKGARPKVDKYLNPLPDEGAERAKAAYRAEGESGILSLYRLQQWGKEIETVREKVTRFVRQAVSSGKRVWAYGASTKGNVLLQWMRLDRDLLLGVADKDLSKVGRYTVGTGIPIHSEGIFRETSPEYAVVLPYAFLPEFVQREREWLVKGGRFIVPLPEPRLVTVTKFGALVEERL